MDFFDDIFKKLFPKRNKTIPLIKENLKRSEKENLEFQIWSASGDAKYWFARIYESYHLKREGQPSSDIEVHLFASAASNGIAITYTNAMSSKQFRFIFDKLKESVLKLPYPYKLYTSDRAHYERTHYIETIEKHYLKPVYGTSKEVGNELKTDGQLPQFYGNILIEYIQIDGEPSFIRLLANIYSDRLFLDALSFEELVKKILN
ncbi:hypothetical protein Fleli_2868 [Bernardetia litoralis DSM 6794]|uniref:Uncharacterized protein n=1 Tax=Bernardetia litoralis (strain ATCC 23117 / DSM 6794 / NBRC 15988 / NCIMB 1366 / Fx l1 / Sio-4) TaxID=880071 RepID=I4AMN6_BERLS|nr:hypothetical protein [Bernardetia litoralis]AFM05221.1 hypothetical protein Fleli_2868 [Bernardetia litoralis DSM 6794]